MSSPYLDKPSRSIKKALEDRGMSAVDVGLDDSRLTEPVAKKGSTLRYVLMACVCLALAIGVLGLSQTLNDAFNEEVMTADEVELMSDELSDIEPAAGPSN